MGTFRNVLRMAAGSSTGTDSIVTVAFATAVRCRSGRESGRITLALHRSNSGVAVRRWLRHCTAEPQPLRYPVNGLLSGLKISDSKVIRPGPPASTGPHRQVAITRLSLPGTALTIGGNQTANPLNNRSPPAVHYRG